MYNFVLFSCTYIHSFIALKASFLHLENCRNTLYLHLLYRLRWKTELEIVTTAVSVPSRCSNGVVQFSVRATADWKAVHRAKFWRNLYYRTAKKAPFSIEPIAADSWSSPSPASPSRAPVLSPVSSTTGCSEARNGECWGWKFSSRPRMTVAVSWAHRSTLWDAPSCASLAYCAPPGCRNGMLKGVVCVCVRRCFRLSRGDWLCRSCCESRDLSEFVKV